MTPEERVDAALDSVLKSSGSALKNYTMPLTVDKMREAMRKAMSDSYIAGSNAAIYAMEHIRVGNARYEIARRMNPRQWEAAWKLNLRTGKPFDEIIDDMRPFMTPNVEFSGTPAALSPEAPLERRVGHGGSDGE